MVSFKIKPRFNKTRCPYCHDDLNGETVECNSCSASHHSECWDELQVCAACSRSNSFQHIRAVLQERRLEFPELRTFSGFLAFTLEVIIFFFGMLAMILVDGISVLWNGFFVLFGLLFELIGGAISLFASLVGLFADLIIFCLPILFVTILILLFLATL